MLNNAPLLTSEKIFSACANRIRSLSSFISTNDLLCAAKLICEARMCHIIGAGNTIPIASDLVIAISRSGASTQVLKALSLAKKKEMKIIYILLAGLCLLSCEKKKIEDVIREVEPEQPSSIHYYYSYKAGEVINAEKLGYASGEFMPGSTYIYGDTLFIANTQSGHFSVELYSLSAHQKIGSLNTWTYNGATQTFNNYVEAISVANERLYLANIGSCIDVFDIHTLKFITRIGNRNWGHGNTQLFHTHAMAIVDDYIIVRMKDGLQVTLQSDVSAEKYQNINYYSRGSLDGFDVNNGFYPHQMAVDTTGLVFLADYGQYGNRKIHVIDTTLIQKGSNITMTTSQTLPLEFNPRGIALYKNLMYISAADGSIRCYDREKKKFFLTFKSVPGYTFKGGQKLLVHNNRLWVTDVSTREIVGVDIFRNVIEEYD